MKYLAVAVCAVVLVAFAAFSIYQAHYRFHRPQITSTYQGVTLVNGEVFYGRIFHLGSDHPVLRGASTVKIEIDPQTQQPRHRLVRRRDSSTGADHLIFPVTSILYVEPVREDSIIGRLLAQEEKRS
jgi:hypothetical protein